MRLLSPSHRAYADIGRNQVYLTEAQEIELTNRYKEERGKLHRYILDRTRCTQHFVKRHKETKAAGRSVAKPSADYNPRKAGLNKSIEEKYNRALDPATWRRGVSTPMSEVLDGLNISDDMYAEMLERVRPTAKLKDIQQEISGIENTLLCSMLMAGQDVWVITLQDVDVQHRLRVVYILRHRVTQTVEVVVEDDKTVAKVHTNQLAASWHTVPSGRTHKELTVISFHHLVPCVLSLLAKTPCLELVDEVTCFHSYLLL